MRALVLICLLVPAAAVAAEADVTVELDGKAHLVVLPQEIRGPDGKPTYKSAMGTAKVTASIAVTNRLPVPITALRVQVQLRTKTGEAPKVKASAGPKAASARPAAP